MINQLLSHEHSGATCFSVFGADVYERYYSQKQDCSTAIVVARAGTQLDVTNGALVVEGKEGTEQLSSTQVRAAMHARDASGLETMVGSELATYLRDLPALTAPNDE